LKRASREATVSTKYENHRKVVFTFGSSKIQVYVGVDARGGFGHVRGTEWDLRQAKLGGGG
ncbi:MAG: hypothetical protein LC775_09675, partial [Acidobacteria bacterium]|nr:hypothetical protein [Acidobacteriota bacterium]